MLCAAWVGLGAGLLPRARRRPRGPARDRDAGGLRHRLRLPLRAADEPLVVALHRSASPCPVTRGRCPTCPARRCVENLHRFGIYTLLTSTGGLGHRPGDHQLAGDRAARSGGAGHAAPGGAQGAYAAPARPAATGQRPAGDLIPPASTASAGWPIAATPGPPGSAPAAAARATTCSRSGRCAPTGWPRTATARSWCPVRDRRTARPARAQGRLPRRRGRARAPGAAGLAGRRGGAAAAGRPAPAGAAAGAAAATARSTTVEPSRPARSWPGSTAGCTSRRRRSCPALVGGGALGGRGWAPCRRRPGAAPAGRAGRVASAATWRGTRPPTGAAPRRPALPERAGRRPRAVAGDRPEADERRPAAELAPMLWNRWDEVVADGDVREAVRGASSPSSTRRARRGPRPGLGRGARARDGASTSSTARGAASRAAGRDAVTTAVTVAKAMQD